jgi:hypothetical protein
MAQVTASLHELPYNILTDLPSMAVMLAQLEVARHESHSLDEVVRFVETGRIPTASGEFLKVPEDTITIDQVALLYYLTVTLKPILSVETDFGVGLMASVMTLAHMQNGLNGGHIPIQDQAKLAHEGIGFYTMQRLGLVGFQLMEHAPAFVLPQVCMQGLNQGFRLAYLNGSGSLDEQIMAYYYLNKMLNPGGVLVVNTTHPARQKLVEFIQKERDDYAVRVMPCGITLIQKPDIQELLRSSNTRH